MDEQTIINIALGLIATLGGWVLKSLSDALKELRVKDTTMDERINTLAVELPTRYVSKDDFQRFEGAIFAKLDRIENKIDQKADKE